MAIERSLKQVVFNESGEGSLYHSKQFNFPMAHAVTHEIILEVRIKTRIPALEGGDACMLRPHDDDDGCIGGGELSRI